jgi:predicted component of type VI protein secretion system
MCCEARLWLLLLMILGKSHLIAEVLLPRARKHSSASEASWHMSQMLTTIPRNLKRLLNTERPYRELEQGLQTLHA